MTPFDWSVIDSQSFGMGMLWCCCTYLIMSIADRLMTSAFEGLVKLGEKQRARKKAKQKEDQDHVR